MTTTNQNSQPQPLAGPIAQQLVKLQSNGQPSPSTQQQPLLKLSEKKSQVSPWTGFSGKTLWDWLQLLGVFLIPLMIGVFTVTSGIQQGQTSQQQHLTDLQIAKDQQQQAILDNYLDHMSNLLLNNKLRTSPSGAEMRDVARAWTMATLGSLDPVRKGIVLIFLYESGLIQKENIIVSLRSVNLEGVKVPGANFSGVSFYGAGLRDADLRGTDLRGTDLTNADLHGADLSDANLTGASITQGQLDTTKSLQGTILPSGSKHP